MYGIEQLRLLTVIGSWISESACNNIIIAKIIGTVMLENNVWKDLITCCRNRPPLTTLTRRFHSLKSLKNVFRPGPSFGLTIPTPWWFQRNLHTSSGSRSCQTSFLPLANVVLYSGPDLLSTISITTCLSSKVVPDGPFFTYTRKRLASSAKAQNVFLKPLHSFPSTNETKILRRAQCAPLNYLTLFWSTSWDYCMKIKTKKRGENGVKREERNLKTETRRVRWKLK